MWIYLWDEFKCIIYFYLFSHCFLPEEDYTAHLLMILFTCVHSSACLA